MIVAGGEQNLDKLSADSLSRGEVHRAVKRDNAAERRGRVCLECFEVGVQCLAGRGDAARVGVLDDHARRGVETTYAVPGRIGIGDVVIGEFFALQLHKVRKQPGWAIRIDVKRRALLRVFAVTQDLFLVDLQGEDVGPGVSGRCGLLSGFGDVEATQVVRDGAIVCGGMGIHLGREL